MFTNDSLVPSTSDSVFQLKGKPLKQWWQIGDEFRLVRNLNAPLDKYENAAIRSTLIFCLTLPFGMALMYHAAGPESIKVVIIASLVGLIMAVHMFLSFRQHGKIAVDVRLSDSGIRVKSPLLQARDIGWGEVAEFFEIQNGDYVLLTTKGEDFVFTSELSNSETLFKRIKELRPRQKELYIINTRLPNSFIDGMIAACLAIVIASVFPIIQLLVYNRTGALTIDRLVFAGVAVLLAVAFYRLQMSKMAELIRFGDDHVLVRTRSGAMTQMLRSEVKNIKKLGACYLISTSSGMFFTIAEKTDAASAKMLELKNLVMIGKSSN